MRDYSDIQPGIYVDHINDPLIVGPYDRSFWGDVSLEDAIEVVLINQGGWETNQIGNNWNLTFALPLEFVE